MKKSALYILITVISLASYGWLGWNIASPLEEQSVPTLCMFKAVTGIPCPSCGTTRSLTFLLEGNLTESLSTNPFGIPAAMMLVVFPLWVIIDWFRKSESFFRWYLSAEQLVSQRSWVAVVSILIVAVNWWWNIEKGL